jgi:enoyl-[acyl-carrier-protein] reductase (NADH)
MRVRNWRSPIRAKPFERRVRPLAESVGADILLDADVLDEASLDRAFAPWPSAGAA